NQFRLKELEELYMKYLQRLHLGYFSVFLVLQTLICVSHAAVLWGTEEALPDAVLYSVTMTLYWPLVLLVFREKLVETFPSITVLVSSLVVLMLLITDMALPLYHTSNHTDPDVVLRPAYTTHTLIVCYVFLPLTENIQPFILGLIVSLSHLVALGTITYLNEDNIIASDTVYLICVNGLGLYFRLMNEVAIRRTFLDRRACIETNSKLEYEKQQEENLMLSIIPRHIIDDVRKDIQSWIQKINTPLRRKPFNDMYVTVHENVTILYADVVRYASLTEKLPVKQLVEILNELFGRFDEASAEHGVLRIKFLGDCYYCVSGVPEYNPNHAKNCVDLGLDMIAIIKKVREARKLNEIDDIQLDMRIGIHSGKILSGLLGICKWQYDVWSHDVIIASNMEQAGKPGKVHITKETLKLLGNKYRYIPGNGSSRNEILKKYNIETFFIVPIERHNELTEDHSMFNRRNSVGGRRRLTVSRLFSQARKSGNDNLAVGSRRRIMGFLEINLYRYQETLKKADEQMAEAIKKMHVGVYDRWLLREKINPLCLTFENIKWEVPFLKQPDPLFKFYVGCALLVLLGMLTIQCLGLPSSHWSPFVGYGLSIAVFLVLLPLTWTHYLWNKFKDPHEEQDTIPEPKNKFLKLLYRASLRVVWSASIRTLLYLIMCFCLTVCTLLELIECNNDVQNTTNDTNEAYVEEPLQDCLPPWHVTQTCSLTLIMSFLFLRIHFQLKLIVGIIIILAYIWGVWFISPHIFQANETWNPGLEPRIAHIINITFLTITLHFMDRQAEYMNRIDYKWKRQLSKEKEESSTMHMINKMLLQNILPIHVADWFLNTSRDHERLYHEEYETVAVMFASLTEYVLWDDNGLAGSSELGSIKLLNQIICDFDKLLYDTSFLRVEKIKVAGWTYMAACGLDPGRKDSVNSLNRDNCSDHVALVLTRFAVKMMEVLQNINRETFQTFKLRVGISHGKLTAGVIGELKPHYDIWGHSVNMASRMESTGEPGRIQVTEETAKVLLENGIYCDYRGAIRVKSIKELVNTYYVNYDEHFHLIQFKTNSVENSEHSSEVAEDDERDYEERFIEEDENNTRL
ncbi:hypothetical protein L9F63_004784, partial [Diploptera punctata]